VAVGGSHRIKAKKRMEYGAFHIMDQPHAFQSFDWCYGFHARMDLGAAEGVTVDNPWSIGGLRSGFPMSRIRITCWQGM